MQLTYRTIRFYELSLDELYNLMRLRQEVFVVEQDCPYLDADGLDQVSYHVLGSTASGDLHGYTRLVPVGKSYKDYISIGRVITSREARGKGIGTALMDYSVRSITGLWPHTPIKISAQSHLQHFYQRFGFVAVGEGYLEDGIPHIGMVRR